MATWNAIPNVPHTGGTFDFPQNTTSNDIVYTIKYTDDNGCTASTTYTVPGGCACDKYLFEDFTHTIADGSSGGGAVAGSVVSAGTLTFYEQASSYWIHFVSRQQAGNNYVYICSMDANEAGSERWGTAAFKSDDKCTFYASVYQGSGTIEPLVYDDYYFEAKSNDGYPTDYSIPLLINIKYGNERGYTGSVSLEQQRNSSNVLINSWKAASSSHMSLTGFEIIGVYWNNTCSCSSVSYSVVTEGGKKIIKVEFNTAGCYH